MPRSGADRCECAASRCAVALCDPVRPARAFRAVGSRDRDVTAHACRASNRQRELARLVVAALPIATAARAAPERSLPATARCAREHAISRTAGRARARTRSSLPEFQAAHQMIERIGIAERHEAAAERRRIAQTRAADARLAARAGSGSAQTTARRARCAADPLRSRGTDRCRRRPRRRTGRNSTAREPAPAAPAAVNPLLEPSVDRTRRLRILHTRSHCAATAARGARQRRMPRRISWEPQTQTLAPPTSAARRASAKSAPTGRWTKCASCSRCRSPTCMFHAQRVHRANFDPNEVQVSTLLSIKTGACPEDCALLLAEHPLRDRAEVRAAAATWKKCSRRRASRAPTARRASAWARRIAARSRSSSRRSPR